MQSWLVPMTENRVHFIAELLICPTQRIHSSGMFPKHNGFLIKKLGPKESMASGEIMSIHERVKTLQKMQQHSGNANRTTRPKLTLEPASDWLGSLNPILMKECSSLCSICVLIRIFLFTGWSGVWFDLSSHPDLCKDHRS